MDDFQISLPIEDVRTAVQESVQRLGRYGGPLREGVDAAARESVKRLVESGALSEEIDKTVRESGLKIAREMTEKALERDVRKKIKAARDAGLFGVEDKA